MNRALKHRGSGPSIHQCKCQRAFRCSGDSAGLEFGRQAALQLASGGGRGKKKRRASYWGSDFKHVTDSAAAGQRNRFLQLQPASRTRVPLTHATVYWSGLRIVVCCSGALGAPHIPLPICILFEPPDISFYPRLSFRILFRLGVFGCQHR